MNWKREIESEHLQSFDMILLSSAALVILGVFAQNIVPYIVAGILTAHLIVLKLFDYLVLRQINIQNPKRSIRLFPGEESTLDLQVENSMLFPIVNGEITWSSGRQIMIKNQEGIERQIQKVTVPASLLPRRKKIIQISFKALGRGTTSVYNLAYHFSHLFNFHPLTIHYKPYYETEFIVYPEIKRVVGVEAVFHLHASTARLMRSPFEDLQDPIGTRDYTSNDSFQRINWKASVRTQNLQTNIYQRVADRSFLFLVNLKTELEAGASEKIENLLSYTAYLCNYAANENESYEVMLNVFRHGNKPFIQQHEGSGSTQLMKSLELLARIPRQPTVLPFEKLLFYATKTQRLPKTIIILGTISTEAAEQIKYLLSNGHHIFYVEEKDGVGVITRFRVEKTA